MSKALEREGSKPAGRNNQVNAAASSNYQPKGVWEGRAAHVTAKATDSILDRNGCWTSPGSQAVARWERSNAEQERPYLAAESGKDRAYKAGRLKVARSREGVRGVRSTEKACKTTRWREGALL